MSILVPFFFLLWLCFIPCLLMTIFPLLILLFPLFNPLVSCVVIFFLSFFSSRGFSYRLNLLFLSFFLSCVGFLSLFFCYFWVSYFSSVCGVFYFYLFLFGIFLCNFYFSLFNIYFPFIHCNSCYQKALFSQPI